MRQLVVATLVLTFQLVLGQEIQCTLEKDYTGEHCVFRDVRLDNNSADVRFIYPADVTKPSQVAFVNSKMEQLPSDFLTLAGSELKVLRVENCDLVSVTIPSGLEELYAKNNLIVEVINQQSGLGPLRKLDLSGNKVRDFSNVTKCQALEMLNLSGNGLEDVLDLGKFKDLNKLRQLDLSHNDINYLDNTGNVNLESLEDLDLSHNNILPSDLNISIFYPYTKLHTLRLNHNYMKDLKYDKFIHVKTLKFVYLNGNRFPCKYLDSMLKYLQQNNLQTPPGELTSCRGTNLDGFCCTGPPPTTLRNYTTTTTIAVSTEPENSPTSKPSQPQTAEEESSFPPISHRQTEGNFTPIWEWVGCIVLIGIGVVIIVVFLIIKKKGSEYMETPENDQQPTPNCLRNKLTRIFRTNRSVQTSSV